MSARGWWLPVAWGALLALPAVMAWIWMPAGTAPLLLTLASAAALLLGAAIALRERRSLGERPRPLPAVSPGAALAAVAVTVLLTGVFGGLWVLMLGAGLAALAVLELGRELLAERRARARPVSGERSP